MLIVITSMLHQQEMLQVTLQTEKNSRVNQQEALSLVLFVLKNENWQQSFMLELKLINVEQFS